MNAGGWFSPDVRDLSNELANIVVPRKLFLLGVAFLRRVETLFFNESCRFAVEVTEQYAHGRASLRDLLESWTRAEAGSGEGLWVSSFDNWCWYDCPTCGGPVTEPPGLGTIHPAARWEWESDEQHQFAARAAWHARQLVADEAAPRQKADASYQEAMAQFDLYRDIVGAASERPRPAPRCVRLPPVRPLLLAVAEMDAIDPVAMLALADALEEARCEEHDLIAHCRQRMPHFRGCWAVEVLLGRSGLRLPERE